MYCRHIASRRGFLASPRHTSCTGKPVLIPRHSRYLASEARNPLLFDRSYVPPTLEARPGVFAIERIGGRECHVSWSENGVVKEWRELREDGDVQPSTAASSSGVTGSVSSWLRQMFLPINYPQSVHRSYMPFHVLQFFETVCGAVVSVLCNQALLTSVGVSAEGSLFGAVAVQWIIKDGAGEVAKLFFIRRFAPYFDSHPKTFALLGEGLVAAGSGLQIATLLIAPTPGNFLLCAAGGNVFKLIGYAIWFTTHIKFVRYFSRQRNTGDVAAKDESQSSVGQLVGYAAGIGLLAVSHSAAYLYALFAALVPAHLVMTTGMMRVATFELLTMPRLTLLASRFVSTEHAAGVPSLRDLERERETGLFGEFYKRKEDRFLSLAPRVVDVVKSDADRARWNVCTDAFANRKYLLFPSPSPSQKISVFFHPDATSGDMLRAVLHAAALRRRLSRDASPDAAACLSAFGESGAWADARFDAFRGALRESGWLTDEIGFADHGHRVLWGAHARSELAVPPPQS